MTFSPKRIVLFSLLLWCSMAALYSPSIGFDFINLDDHTVLLGHPDLYNQDSLLSSLKEIFFTYFPREEPLLLRDVTWAIDSCLFGFTNPVGYHLGNVIINSSTVTLLFLLLVLWSKQPGVSLLTAFTFGVLAVHVEPVCWVMGRKDLLATFFMVLTLIAQTEFLKSSHPKKRRPLYLFTILTTLAALLSKINTVSFVAVLAAHQLFFPYITGQRRAGAPLELRRLGGVVLLRLLPHMMITVFIAVWYKQVLNAWGLFDRSVDSFSMTHLANLFTFIPMVLLLYGKLVFLPGQFSILYDWPSIHHGYSPLLPLASGGIWILLALAAIGAFAKRKDLFFYLITFLLLMAPYFNVVYAGIWVANRYVYFASFFLIAGLSGLPEKIPGDKKLGTASALLAWTLLILFNLCQNVRYQQTWKNDHALWAHETALKRPSPLSFASLASAKIMSARKTTDPAHQNALLEQADSILQNGMDIFTASGTPNRSRQMSRLYFVRGVLAEARGQSYTQQMEHFKDAQRVNPGDAQVAKKLAETVYRKAMETEDPEQRERLAHRSLDYFVQSIRLSFNDRYIQKDNLSILNNIYRMKFPFLGQRLEAAGRLIHSKSGDNFIN